MAHGREPRAFERDTKNSLWGEMGWGEKCGGETGWGDEKCVGEMGFEVKTT